MNDSLKGSAKAESNEATLPVLITRLGEDLVSLIDAKLSLLQIELQEDLRAYSRHLVALVTAGVVGAVGFALVNVAVAFAVAELLGGTALSATMQYALGFAATGLVYLVAGGLIAIGSWQRLSKRVPAPVKAIAELKTDN